MPLMKIDIEKLVEAVDWIDGDIEDMEGLLKYAGKGESGHHENYYLTLGIYHLTEASKYLSEIIEGYEVRNNKSTIKNGPTITTNDILPIAATGPIQIPTQSVKKDEKDKGENLVAINKLIDEVFKDYPERVDLAKSGEKGHLGFLTAQVVVRSSAQANTSTVFDLLGERIAA